MNTMNSGNRVMKMIRKLSFLADEAVWHLALAGVIVAAVVDGVLSIGGGTIA